mmetsp:Transcript_14818/g.40716  ORF Transcript_14818/g.40716 Transcript_14818/m.40716 type:complete len:203 (+) Transcript_14818:477-1085(+)
MRFLSCRARISSSFCALSISVVVFWSSFDLFNANMARNTRSFKAFTSEADCSACMTISSAMRSRSPARWAVKRTCRTFSLSAFMSDAALAISMCAFSHSSAMASKSPGRPEPQERRRVLSFLWRRGLRGSTSSTPDEEDRICCSRRAACCSHSAFQVNSSAAFLRLASSFSDTSMNPCCTSRPATFNALAPTSPAAGRLATT